MLAHLRGTSKALGMSIMVGTEFARLLLSHRILAFPRCRSGSEFAAVMKGRVITFDECLEAAERLTLRVKYRAHKPFVSTVTVRTVLECIK